MGWFDWTVKQKYDTEKELLRALLEHAEGWYNELTEPLRELLYDLDHISERPLDSEKYYEVAMALYNESIKVNHGDGVKNTIEQMSGTSIPLFLSRPTLQRLTEEYLDSGHLLKDIVIALGNWSRLDKSNNYERRQDIKKAWDEFRRRKDKVVKESNKQIRRLG